MKLLGTLLSASFLGAFLVGCVADSMDSSAVEQKEENIYSLERALWPTPNIPVCWENASSANALQRDWVRQAVERTWQHHANVNFTDWGSCTSGKPGVHIQINDSGPHVKALGRYLSGVTNGMVLNFSFQNWSPSCQSKRQSCIETIAVHEFGHALGFAHEQNRPDTPNFCDQEQGQDGDTLTGPWDLNSVMNYCNPKWSGDGNLSLEDIRGLRRTYGAKPGSLQLRHKNSGQCLYNSGAVNGGKVDHWACWDDPNMDYELVPVSGHGYNAVRLRHRNTNSCIYGNAQNGGAVNHWTCWNDPNMVYIVEALGKNEVRLRHKSSGKCLYTTGGNGAGTYNWTCWDDPNMVFTLENTNPRTPAVCFYRDGDHQGEASCYDYGEYPRLGGADNTFSSLSMLETATATAFQERDFMGLARPFSESLQSLDAGFNDTISSLRVERSCQEFLECERGTSDGAHCHLGTVPSNREVYRSGGDLYYSAAKVCQVGGFDSANCYLGGVPAGSSTFFWGNNLYYTPVNGNECPVSGTWFDSANCYVGSLDHGFFAYNGGLYQVPQKDPASCVVPGSTFDGSACKAAAAWEDPFAINRDLYIPRSKQPASWPVPTASATMPVDGEWVPTPGFRTEFSVDLYFQVPKVECSDVRGYEVEVRLGSTVLYQNYGWASGEDIRERAYLPGSSINLEHSWRVRLQLENGSYQPWTEQEYFTPALVVGMD